MKTKTMIGKALLILSYWLFVLSEILGDAGNDYEETAPPYIERCKAWAWRTLARIQTEGERCIIRAGAAVVYIACCLTAFSCWLWTAIKRKVPEVRKTCAKGATWMKETGRKQAENVKKAWAFRAEVMAAEGRPA